MNAFEFHQDRPEISGGTINLYFRYSILSLLTSRRTPEQTGHWTSLFAAGGAFLYYAVETLHVECMRPLLRFEQGQTVHMSEYVGRV
jgi:hypothetical protein